MLGLIFEGPKSGTVERKEQERSIEIERNRTKRTRKEHEKSRVIERKENECDGVQSKK